MPDDVWLLVGVAVVCSVVAWRWLRWWVALRRVREGDRIALTVERRLMLLHEQRRQQGHGGK